MFDKRLFAPSGRWATFLLVALMFSTPVAESQEAAHSTERWLGPEGQPLPFESDEQVVEFLRTARVVSQKELSGGINRPLKLRLEKDGVEANAIFRLVDVRLRRARLDGKLVADFHDSYIYECAAYHVSRMLGIDNVPPCVKRDIQRANGTVQLWVESATTEEGRRADGMEPPKLIHWLRQKQTMRLFDALIYNFDRNQGNMLIDSNWKLWFIDHTRSFRKSSVIENPQKIIWCEQEIWERLQSLDKKQLTKSLRGYLTSTHINYMIKRRDKLVDNLKARIDRMGEGAVLYAAGSGDVSEADLTELHLDDEIPATSSLVEEAIDGP